MNLDEMTAAEWQEVFTRWLVGRRIVGAEFRTPPGEIAGAVPLELTITLDDGTVLTPWGEAACVTLSKEAARELRRDAVGTT